MALRCWLPLLAFVSNAAAATSSISAHSFEDYVAEPGRQTVYAQRGTPKLRSAVAAAEGNYTDKVVLYHVMPLYGYLMSWLSHGILAKQPLKWQRDSKSPDVSAQLPLQLRLFDPGRDFPSFALHEPSVCAGKALRKVREADLENARLLGDGDWTNYYQTSEDFFNISYSHGWKTYVDCSDLAYSQLVEANANVAPLVQEDILKLHGITTAKGFAQYMGSEVSEIWQDAAFPGSNDGLPTVGVQDRLVPSRLNLLGTAINGAWEEATPTAWAQFTEFVNFVADLSADHFSAAGAKPDFGDRTPVLDRLLDLLSPGPAVVEKVANLLSLLKCSAHMRFPIYQQSFWMRRRIMEQCWEGTAEPFPPDAPKLDLDSVASKRTKEAALALAKDGGTQVTQFETRGYSRILLQVVIPADMADELLYVSTDWNDKSGFAPGHEHPQWKGVSFTEAYNELKNTARGDGFTARVLWRREPFFTGDAVKLIAYGQVFADEKFMQFAESLLNDIRADILGLPLTEQPMGWLQFLGFVALFLVGLFLLVATFLSYRRRRAQRPGISLEPVARSVELPEQPLRASLQDRDI